MSLSVEGGSRWSKVTVLGLWAMMFLALLVSPPANIISWDVFGYYLYLPATFIHHDITIPDISWVEQAREIHRSSSTLYQAQMQPNGTWVLKYPMGMALLLLPFFLAGHLFALVSGHPADGFSAPYQWALIIATLAFVLLGSWMLMRVLRTFLSDRMSALVLALVLLGTNYLHQVLYSTGMPHVLLFALQAALLWYTIQWHAKPRYGHAAMIGLLIGLLCLARPSELVVVVLPLLYGMSSPTAWRERALFWWRARTHVLLAATVMLSLALLQFVYWKTLTGRFLYMSYNNPGEGLDLLAPHVWEVLFSFRKGWDIYTPLMVFATVGAFLLRKRAQQWTLAIPVFIVLDVYIVSSWSCWWYADSFGQRAMVQSYAVMAIPLGALLLRSFERGRLGRTITITFLTGCVLLNVFQTWQCANGLIHTSRMTWPAYRAVFLERYPEEDLQALWSVDRSQDVFRSPPDAERYRRIPLRTLTIPGTLALPWDELSATDHVFVEVHLPADVDVPAAPDVAVVLSMRHAGYPYAERKVTLAGNEATSVWYLTPEVRTGSDSVHVELTGGRPGRAAELHLHIPRSAVDTARSR